MCNFFNRYGVSFRKTPAFISVVVRASSCRLHLILPVVYSVLSFHFWNCFATGSGGLSSPVIRVAAVFLMNGMQRVLLGYGFICLAFSSKPSSLRVGIVLCISYWLLESYCLMTLSISIVQSVLDEGNVTWTLVECSVKWKPRHLERKAAPLPLCPPQIPHGRSSDRTRASAVTGRRQAVCPVTRPRLRVPFL